MFYSVTCSIYPKHLLYSLAIRSVSVVLPKSCSSYGQLLVLLFLSRHCCLADDFNTLRPPRLESEKDITKHRQSTSHNFIVLPSDKLDYSLIACHREGHTISRSRYIIIAHVASLHTYMHTWLNTYLGNIFAPSRLNHVIFSFLTSPPASFEVNREIINKITGTVRQK